MSGRGWLMSIAAIALAFVLVGVLLMRRGSSHRELTPPDNGDATGVNRPKGFKLVDYFPTSSNGVQRIRSILTGSEGELLTNGLIYLVNPRIESFREDGNLDFVATSLDAIVDREGRSARGTNLVSGRTADTNAFFSGRGFQWQQSNSVLIVLDESYTWVNIAAMTNSRSKK